MLQLRPLFLALGLAVAGVLPVQAGNIIHVPSQVGDLQTAINQSQEGDTIEIAAGTYNAPPGGFAISNLGDSITIRAASPGSVTLSGQGSGAVLVFLNGNSAANNYSVVFEGLIFANGSSTTDGRGGGVTLQFATATFVDCEFNNNSAAPPQTGGGGVFLRDESVAHFIDCEFNDNDAKNEGAGLRVGDGTKAFVHRTLFSGNRTNLSGHRTSANGAAIHVTNAHLWVTNSRFVNNQAGCSAGAIFVLGTWTDPNSVPVAGAWITNSTFTGNRAAPDPTVTCVYSPEGGAVQVEDQAEVVIYNSRFVENFTTTSGIFHGVGGALALYRSKGNVYESVFRGNRAATSGSSLGGAILVNSNDTPGDGATNRPSARLVVERSYFQGRFGATTFAANKGGCIGALGDTNRTYGQGGVSQNGEPAQNRTVVEIRDSLFHDCDAQLGDAGTGTGGAMELSHVALTLERSLLIRNDAGDGSFGAGGALRLLFESAGSITDTTFADDSAAFAGAVEVFGSDVDFTRCQFIGNSVSSDSRGSAIRSRPNDSLLGSPKNAAGAVRDSVFAGNSHPPIAEFDFVTGPINAYQYFNNDFSPGGNVFHNTIAGVGFKDVPGLNSLVVVRNVGVGNTTKSPNADNAALGSTPSLGALVAVPTKVLATAAPGDAVPPNQSFVGYAWSGSSAELDSSPLGASSGVAQKGAGTHTLDVDGELFQVTVTSGAVPGAQISADPLEISGGQLSSLTWLTTSGASLHGSVDRRVDDAAGSSGSTDVQPLETTTYRYHAVTQTGGAVAAATVYVDEPAPIIFSDAFESGDLSAWSASVP